MSVYGRTELIIPPRLTGWRSRVEAAKRAAKNHRNLIGHFGLAAFGAVILAWQLVSVASLPRAVELTARAGIAAHEAPAGRLSASDAPVWRAMSLALAEAGQSSLPDEPEVLPSCDWAPCRLSRAFPDLLIIGK
jgi:hypothetical protein